MDGGYDYAVMKELGYQAPCRTGRRCQNCHSRKVFDLEAVYVSYECQKMIDILKRDGKDPKGNSQVDENGICPGWNRNGDNGDKTYADTLENLRDVGGPRGRVASPN